MCALCIVCPCFFSPFAIRSSFSSDLDLFIEATHSHSQYSQSFLWLLLWAVLLFPSCTNAHAFTRLALLIVFAHWLISLKTFHFPLYVHVGSICWCNSSKWFSCRMRFYRIQQCLFPARLACQRIKALNASQCTQRLRSMKILCSHQTKFNINESAFFWPFSSTS